MVFLANLRREKDLINGHLTPMFNNINAAISASKIVCASNSERAIKLLSMHEKNVKKYFEKNVNGITDMTYAADSHNFPE